MVFSNRFFNWIIECISTTCHLILVNGPSSKVCYAKRGLKQGDSLSSFLFTFAMEHLSLSLQSRVETGYLKTFKLGGNLVESHLIYIVDMVVFYKTTKKSIGVIMDNFKGLERGIGLLLN